MIHIWGHRGCRGEDNPPENSLAAFRAAVDQGADGIELDVFLTKDGQLVVFHDKTLERMSNGRGRVTDHTLAELKQLRLKDSSETIPTLDEVLDEMEKIRPSHFVVDVEIKSSGVASQVAEVLRKRLASGWLPDHFQVSAFDLQNLRDMKKILPEIPRGTALASAMAPWNISETALASRLEDILDIESQTINLTLPSLTPAAIRMIRGMGAEPVAWTYNEIPPNLLPQSKGHELVEQLSSTGIHAIITDYPGPMRNFIDSR